MSAALTDAMYGPAGFAAQWAAGHWRAWTARARPALPEEISAADFALRAVPRLVIGATNLCNARCRFCAYRLAILGKNRPAGVMPMDVAADAISRYASAGGRAVDFTSTMGEPTLCPHLPAIVRSAVAAGMRERSMVTNGILLGRDDDAADLLDSGLTQVTVSTADFDREVYALVMGVDRFSDLCEGLDALLRANARRRWPARISVCVRNALPPSVTLRSPAWRAIVEPHRRRIAVHFTIAFDSWCGSLRESDFLGRMRMRPALPWTDTPCIGLFQPVVLHDGQVRLCPCRSHGSEYDGLVVGTLDDYADRALNIARGFYRGARPPPCRTCSFYQPITLRWLRARRARLTAAPSA